MRTRTRNQELRERLLQAPVGRELRLIALDDIQIRAAGGEGSAIGFTGIAAVFNSRTLIGSPPWGWYEEVQRGAFAQSLVEDDIRMLKNHNTDLVLARNLAGNLRLAEVDKGLATDADMTPTTYAQDLALSLETGDVSQMSFGFEVKDDEWLTLPDDHPDKGKVIEPELRIIKRVKLWEVSPVTFPAYTDTEASLRFRDLQTLAEGLELDDERLHQVAAALRSEQPDPEVLRALATGLERKAAPAKAPEAPAIEPTTNVPAEGPGIDELRGHVRHNDLVNLRRTA